MDKKQEPDDRDPVLWFAVLRRASEAQDRDLAAAARDALRRLGYSVSIARDQPSAEAVR